MFVDLNNWTLINGGKNRRLYEFIGGDLMNSTNPTLSNLATTNLIANSSNASVFSQIFSFYESKSTIEIGIS